MKTLADLYQEAIDIQNASNLSGIVHSFSRAMTRLRELENGKDTAFYNRHPIAVLYSSKIASLTDSDDGFVSAYAACLAGASR